MKKTLSSAKKPIGEGSYRRVFEIDDRLVGKELKHRRVKKYGPLTVRYPMGWYCLFKFGIRDINLHDFKKYQELKKKIPDALKGNFGEIVDVKQRGKESVLLMKKVKNYDGKMSKSLIETGSIASRAFWEKIDQIEKFFLENDVHYFIYPQDIAVRWISEKECEPVIIDFKRIGARTYPAQPHLVLKSQAKKRVKRLFARLKEKYGFRQKP